MSSIFFEILFFPRLFLFIPCHVELRILINVNVVFMIRRALKAITIKSDTFSMDRRILSSFIFNDISENPRRQSEILLEVYSAS